MTDHSSMRLGKRPAVKDPRTLRLARYMGALPPPPVSVDWTAGRTDWGMCLNDQLGDCVIAGIAHCVLTWTSLTGKPVQFTDADILSLYEAIGGYNPQDPATDQGCVELDALIYWRTKGCVGDTLGAFASVNPQNDDETRHAVDLFGCSFVGLNLPTSAQTQDVWDVGDAPGGWGGHCVMIPAFNAVGPVYGTWGMLKQATWAFHNRYCDEQYALIGNDWLIDGKTLEGIDLPTLKSDLQSLG